MLVSCLFNWCYQLSVFNSARVCYCPGEGHALSDIASTVSVN